MSKIEEFEKWAKQFIAIQDSHVRGFLGSIGDMSLHEMKVLFSERHQGKIEFSYWLQVEKTIIKNLHIEPRIVEGFFVSDADRGNDDSSDNGGGSSRNYSYGDGYVDGYGFPDGDGCGCFEGYGSLSDYWAVDDFDDFLDGSGRGYGEGYGYAGIYDNEYGYGYASGDGRDDNYYYKKI